MIEGTIETEETSNTVEKGEVFQKFLNVEAKSLDFDGDKEQVVASLGMRMQVSKRRSTGSTDQVSQVRRLLRVMKYT